MLCLKIVLLIYLLTVSGIFLVAAFDFKFQVKPESNVFTTDDGKEKQVFKEVATNDNTFINDITEIFRTIDSIFEQQIANFKHQIGNDKHDVTQREQEEHVEQKNTASPVTVQEVTSQSDSRPFGFFENIFDQIFKNENESVKANEHPPNKSVSEHLQNENSTKINLLKEHVNHRNFSDHPSGITKSAPIVSSANVENTNFLNKPKKDDLTFFVVSNLGSLPMPRLAQNSNKDKMSDEFKVNKLIVKPVKSEIHRFAENPDELLISEPVVKAGRHKRVARDMTKLDAVLNSVYRIRDEEGDMKTILKNEGKNKNVNKLQQIVGNCANSPAKVTAEQSVILVPMLIVGGLLFAGSIIMILLAYLLVRGRNMCVKNV